MRRDRPDADISERRKRGAGAKDLPPTRAARSRSRSPRGPPRPELALSLEPPSQKVGAVHVLSLHADHYRIVNNTPKRKARMLVHSYRVQAGRCSRSSGAVIGLSCWMGRRKTAFSWSNLRSPASEHGAESESSPKSSCKLLLSP